ncbi:MAG: PP2C family protein-serine/threonine phosphatase [bacterium]
MLPPKTFYRKFDYLLKKISKRKSIKNFLYSILQELEKTFGDDLYFGNVRLYEERGDEFVLIWPSDRSKITRAATKLSIESKAVQELLEHGSYIYDNHELCIDPEISRQHYYAIPAAFTVATPDQRWIAVMVLREGWVREEITFCINAVRTALNYRLYSEAIESDLEQAAHIQQSLLPGHIPQISGYQISARSQPAELVGGDLFDFFEFGNEVFGFCIGDASGHGLPAALVVRDVVIGLRMGLEKNMKMVYTFQKLNNVIYRSTYSSRFVSLFYGEIERDGHLIYVNAGHPAPLLIHGNEVQELKATGLILGALPEITLHRSYAYMEPNSILVLYSDGIFERENQKQESYSIERLKRLVVQNQDKNAQQIQNLIFEDVFEYGNRGKWEDDSTLMVIKRPEI